MVWILESNWKATEVEIVKDGREFVIVRTKGSTGGFLIRKNRLFPLKKQLKNQKKTPLQVVVIMDHLVTK